MNNKWFRIFVILRIRFNIQFPCYSCATSHFFIKSNVLGNTVVAHIGYYRIDDHDDDDNDNDDDDADDDELKL